jgi:dipeptidyl-peptidase-4
VNELIRQDKPFRMMSYPNRSHAIKEGANTTTHLRELMTSFLREKLPAGPR